MSPRRLNVGVAGLGRAFTLMVPTFVADPRIRLVAAADPRQEATARFAAEFGARAHDSVESLCADPAIDVVYVATPHGLHAAHVAAAAAQGKHVLVEKPMAVTLAECRAMNDAVDRAGVRMVVGHSHGFDAPIARTREIIASGVYGAVKMIHAQYYTDFLYRLRRPEELDTEQGGGVVFSQAAHQVDIVRLLGGGEVTRVRALTGNWDPVRPTEGAYAALLTFARGAFASLVYSGYGRFDGDSLCGGISELGMRKDPRDYGASRKRLAPIRSSAAEAAAKAARNYGGAAEVAAPGRAQTDDVMHQHFGLVVVSCERADLRPLPEGVLICRDDAQVMETLPMTQIPRKEVIDELYAAVVDGAPPLHDGRWGMATLEVCLAMLASAREQRDVALHAQVAVSDRPSA
jgi:phthalate 4,5-cis-dihydrodiol dehydrogenase